MHYLSSSRVLYSFRWRCFLFFSWILNKKKSLPHLISPYYIAWNNIFGHFFFLRRKGTLFIHLFLDLFLQALKPFSSLFFFALEIRNEFTDFAESIVPFWLGTNSIRLFFCSQYDFLSDGILLEVDWGRAVFLLSIGDKFWSNGFWTFWWSDACILSKSIPRLFYHFYY